MMRSKLLHHSLCEDIVGPAHRKNIFFAKYNLFSDFVCKAKYKLLSFIA